MPGYIMHLAIAQEYLKKHSNVKENKAEFIKGTVYPDMVEKKSLTHYGYKSSKIVLKDFLKENKINNSFNRAYFLHLIADYLFYNKYLEIFTNDIYNDYDITNKPIIEKYNVKIPKNVKKYAFYKER